MCLSEKERGKIWKGYLERIMNGENDWDHNVEGGVVEGSLCKERGGATGIN